VSTGGPSLRLVVHDEETAQSLRRFDEHRGGGTPAEIILSVDAAAESVVRIRQSAGDPPLGVVARTEAEAFAAVASGADDACVAEDLDLPRYIAFLDRVDLRARQRREAENRRAAAAHAEKLAALGTVVAGVAHEVNNPLSVVVLLVETIRGMVEPLLQGQDEIFRLAQRGTLATAEEVERLAEVVQTGSRPSDVRSSLDDATNSLNTIQAIVRDLRIFARAQDDERDDAVFLPDLVEHVLRVAGAHLKTIATLERDYGENLPILRLPRSRIAQVLTNLLINASHAIADTKRETHRVRISLRCDAEALAISVSDTGPGIPPEIIERIFDPFFTTKSGEGTSGGTGLGLSISRSILQALGGDLVVESVHGEGATFIALIPIADRVVAGEPKKKARNAVPVAPQRASVLVIDDDEALLRTFATALRGRFHVLLASEGQEAIDLIVSGSKPDALLCDVSMPVVDGPHFYRWLLDNRPALVDHTVFMSANVDGEVASAFATVLGKPLLEKPMTREQLIAVLDRAAGAPK
jgi:signal transduction histidine kinase/CheY-like chemotaxis protein